MARKGGGGWPRRCCSRRACPRAPAGARIALGAAFTTIATTDAEGAIGHGPSHVIDGAVLVGLVYAFLYASQ
jgi:hypothetical protein